MRQTITYDLGELIEQLVEMEAGISELHLFGSRAYGTLSLRSDCDVIVRADADAHIKMSDLREFALENCAALDLFLCTETRAVSVANDSFVQAATFDDLVCRLDAQLLWTRDKGFSDFAFRASGDWTFEVSAQVEFVPSVLPDAMLEETTWQSKMQKVETSALPTRPYIGDSLTKALSLIVEVSRRMVMHRGDLGKKGAAPSGWTVNLGSEYDCQNLFYSVVKPWLPGLGREEITLHFDGQKKQSDFSLFEGRLVIEMKFVDSGGKKAEVVKTMDGLARFYSRNANVGALLFIVYVKGDVELDESRWEQDYSFLSKAPTVTTIVIRVP